MPDVTLAQALGVGPIFTFTPKDGGTSRDLQVVSFTTNGLKVEFQRFLEKSAYNSLFEAKSWMDEEDYNESLTSYRRDKEAHKYAWGQELAGEALKHDDTVKHLAFLCLKWGNPKEVAICKVAIEEIWADPEQKNHLLELMSEVSRDPNVHPPAVKPGA